MIPTLPVILWKAILIPLALIQFQNFVFVILMFVAYIFTIKYIYHCADGLEYAGYDVPAAPVRISGGRLMLIYVLAILLGITGFTWGFGYVDLTTQAEPAETLQMSLTRQTLIQQGFPEDALNQIQEDDLQGIKDVKGVYVDEENTDDQFMKASIIAVHNGDGRVKWFIPFVYKENEHSVLVDSIKIFCDSDTRSEGGTGVISYAKKGKAYQVRIPLDTETKERIWFGDVNEDRTLNAKYSFPLFSKEQKGYFTYWSGSAGDTPYTFGICSATFYCQRNYFVLPYVKLPYQSSSMDIFQSGFGDRMGEYRNQVYTTIELQTEETETT